MFRATGFRTHLLELVVVFVGVGLAFAVENLREDLNEDAVALEHLAGFHEDLQSDLVMLDEQIRLKTPPHSPAFRSNTRDPGAQILRILRRLKPFLIS